MTLAELITARRNELNLSYERIAARAGERGIQVSPTTLFALANEEPRALPRPDTLRALAVALDLPVSEVLMAAARSVGLVGRDGGDPNRSLAWTEITEDLDAEQMDQVLDVVRSVVKVIKPGPHAVK